MALNVNIGSGPMERCGLSFCLIHKTLNVKSCVTIMNFRFNFGMLYNIFVFLLNEKIA